MYKRTEVLHTVVPGTLYNIDQQLQDSVKTVRHLLEDVSYVTIILINRRNLCYFFLFLFGLDPANVSCSAVSCLNDGVCVVDYANKTTRCM